MTRKVMLFLSIVSFLAMASFVVVLSTHAADDLAATAVAANGHTSWVRITVDSQNDVGQYLSLAAQYGSDVPYIAYYDATAGDLKLAQRTAGNCGPNQTWSCVVLDGNSSTDVGQYVSLAFNGSDYGVVYYDAFFGVNRYTNPASGIWGETVEFVAGFEVGQVNDLVYDDGVPHVAYYRDVPNGRFGYARRVGSGGNCAAWQCTVIAPVGGSFAIDAALYSGLGIAYSSTASGLGYAVPVNGGGNCGDGQWACTTINANALPTATSLQMAHCGLLGCSSPAQIAYYDYLQGILMYAVRVENGQGNCPGNANWTCSLIEFLSTPLNPVAPGLSLLVVNDQPVIIYQDLDDQTNSILKAAWPEADGNCGPHQDWRCVVVDSGARVGGFVDVGQALDAKVIDGRIHIAYDDADNGDLLLAYEPAAVPPPPTPSPAPTPDPTAAYYLFLPSVMR